MDHSRRTLIACLWLLGFLAALLVDGPVARLVRPLHDSVKQAEFAEEMKESGHFAFTIVVAVVLGVLHREKWRASLLLLLSGGISGLISWVIAVSVVRVRPVVRISPFEFHPFSISPFHAFHVPNLSFPSGHATLAFATAAALSYLLPKGRWLFYCGAILCGLERIAESAHYVSDVVAAAVLGILAFRIALTLWRWAMTRIDRAAARAPTMLGLSQTVG
ncbi:MAG: phosphatase PAP2 family protein [Tepidisphaeraceae bacterium]